MYLVNANYLLNECMNMSIKLVSSLLHGAPLSVWSYSHWTPLSYSCSGQIDRSFCKTNGPTLVTLCAVLSKHSTPYMVCAHSDTLGNESFTIFLSILWSKETEDAIRNRLKLYKVCICVSSKSCVLNLPNCATPSVPGVVWKEEGTSTSPICKCS